MGWFVASVPDPVFIAELRALDRSDHWKRFAISGRMMGLMHFDDGRPDTEGPMVGPAEDLRAWRWGYDWKEGGPPPVERPEGACPECWRLGEACNEHYEREEPKTC